MGNSRNFLNESDENDHALVPSIVEVRDSLGALAVQVLASREDLAKLSYPEMLQKLHTIVKELHQAYDSNRLNLY